MEIKERIEKWWKLNDGQCVFVAAAITAFIEYYYYFSLEPMHSDVYAEGLLKYSGITRCITLDCWAEVFYYFLTSFVIHPWFEHAIYTVCIATATMFIIDMWQIRTRLMRILSVMILMSSPAITGQILYIYTYHSYGIAFLLAVVSVYMMWHSRSWWVIIPASIIMSISLGFESIYIAAIIILVIGCLMIQLLWGKELQFASFVHSTIRYILYGIAGVTLFWGIAKFFQAIFHVSTAQYAGAEKVGLFNTIMNIPIYIKSTYRQFAVYYSEAKLGGSYLWCGLIVLAMICVLFHTIKMIRDRRYWSIAATFLLIMSIPVGANIMLIILPEHGMQLHWIYQMQIIAPLCVAIITITLYDMIKDKSGSEKSILLLNGGVRITCSLVAVCLVGLIMSYGFCAYSSFRTLDIGSKHIKLYIQNALTHAIEDEQFEKGMPILFAGFVSDDKIQENNPLREYSYYEKAYPFWGDRYEVFSVWPKYCWYNFGIDIGRVAPEQYDSIIESEEFKAMEQYPSNKAFAVIDGCYVILMDRESVQK